MSPNKSLQVTSKPLRAFAALDLKRYAASWAAGRSSERGIAVS